MVLPLVLLHVGSSLLDERVLDYFLELLASSLLQLHGTAAFQVTTGEGKG